MQVNSSITAFLAKPFFIRFRYDLTKRDVRSLECVFTISNNVFRPMEH